MKTSTLIILVFTIISVVFSLSALEIYREYTQIGEDIQIVSERADVALTDNFALSQLVKDIKFDVVQVQQWLTDISATRGLDGLDDGKEKAGEFAGKFANDLKKARQISEKLELPDVVKSLNELERAFPPYYDVGQRMADAYIQSGATGGNRMMGEFDAVAENMSVAVDNMTSAVEKITNADRSNVVQKLDQVNAVAHSTLQILVMVFSGVLAVFLLTGVFLVVFLKKRASSTQELVSRFEASVQKISSELKIQASGLSHRARNMSESLESMSDKTSHTSKVTTEVSGMSNLLLRLPKNCLFLCLKSETRFQNPMISSGNRRQLWMRLKMRLLL